MVSDLLLRLYRYSLRRSGAITAPSSTTTTNGIRIDTYPNGATEYITRPVAVHDRATCEWVGTTWKGSGGAQNA